MGVRIPHGFGDKPSYGAAAIDPTHPLAKRLVGCYLLNEARGWTAHDLTRRTGKGTLTNGAKFVSTQKGSAVKFDGSNDHITLGGDPTSMDCGAGNFAISVIFQTDSPGTARQMLVAKDSDSAGRQIEFAYYTSSTIRLVYYKTAAGSADDPLLDANIGTVSAGVWYHILAQRNGNSFEIYRDGTLRGSGTTTGTHGTMHHGSTGLTAGTRLYAGFNDPLNGRIAAIWLWRRALTDKEALKQYDDPYAMLRPTARRAFVVAAGDVTSASPKRLPLLGAA